MKINIFNSFMFSAIIIILYCEKTYLPVSNEGDFTENELNFHLEYSFGAEFVKDKAIVLSYDTIDAGRATNASMLQYSIYDSSFSYVIRDAKTINDKSTGVFLLHKNSGSYIAEILNVDEGMTIKWIGNDSSKVNLYFGKYWVWEIEDSIRDVSRNSQVHYSSSLEDSLLLVINRDSPYCDTVEINSDNLLKIGTFRHMNKSDIILPDSISDVKIYNRIRRVQSRYLPVIIVSFPTALVFIDSVVLKNNVSGTTSGWNKVTDIYFGFIEMDQ